MKPLTIKSRLRFFVWPQLYEIWRGEQSLFTRCDFIRGEKVELVAMKGSLTRRQSYVSFLAEQEWLTLACGFRIGARVGACFACLRLLVVH